MMILIPFGFQDWVFEFLNLKLLLSLFQDTHLEEKSTFSKITDEQRAKIIETIVRDFDIEGLSFEHIETERKWFLVLFRVKGKFLVGGIEILEELAVN